MKKTALLLAVWLTTAAHTEAQSTTTQPDPQTLSWGKNKKVAKKLLKKGGLETAVPYLEAGATKNPKKKYFAEALAPLELRLRNYSEANKWYKVLVDGDSVKHKKPLYLYEYAVTQKHLGLYEESSNTFNKFIKLASDKAALAEFKRQARREVEGNQLGIYYRDSVANPEFEVTALSANINQPFEDFSPVVKGNALYYTALKSNDVTVVDKKEKLASFGQIYKAVQQGNDFSKGEAISENVNTTGFHVGDPTFTPDGNTMYYTQCTETDTRSFKCKLMRSKLENRVWTKGEDAGVANDLIFSSTQPAYGKNNEGDAVIYFASDRNIEKGFDIYYAKINADGSLGKARSLGSQVNSRKDEASPFFDLATNTLYFSSKGWKNIGGFDVFKSTWDKAGDWTEPENLGTPINSSADDIYFSVNGDKVAKGYLASNRVGGLSPASNATGFDDIYTFGTTRTFLAVKGIVQEIADGAKAPASGTAVLVEENEEREIAKKELANGEYFFDLEANHSYRLTISKEGYTSVFAVFNTNGKTGSDTIVYNLELKKKQAEVIGSTLATIYYEYNKSTLASGSSDSLKKVIDFIKQNPNAIIEVAAHTDGKGSASYNQKLSENRAKSAISHLEKTGKIDKNHFTAKGYGSSKPVAADTLENGKDNPEGRAKNRRTEFVVIGLTGFSTGTTKTETTKIELKKLEPKALTKKAAATLKPIAVKRDSVTKK